MSEQSQRARVVRGLADLHAVAVENPVMPGTPDVNYVEGWLELKCLSRWPRGEETPVRVPHFRREQRIWIRRRALRGGRVHVLLQVERDWLLLPGQWAADRLGEAPRAELIHHARGVWFNKMNMKELVQCLTTT